MSNIINSQEEIQSLANKLLDATIEGLWFTENQPTFKEEDIIYDKFLAILNEKFNNPDYKNQMG